MRRSILLLLLPVPTRVSAAGAEGLALARIDDFGSLVFECAVTTEGRRTPLLHRLSVFISWLRSPEARKYDDAIVHHVCPDIIKYMDEVVIPCDHDIGREIREACFARAPRPKPVEDSQLTEQAAAETQ